MSEQQKKTVVQWKECLSDRIDLCKEANALIFHLIYKQEKPWLETPFGTLEALTPNEEEAKNAALNYLTTQFREGAHVAEIFLSQDESEEKNPIS